MIGCKVVLANVDYKASTRLLQGNRLQFEEKGTYVTKEILHMALILHSTASYLLIMGELRP